MFWIAYMHFKLYIKRMLYTVTEIQEIKRDLITINQNICNNLFCFSLTSFYTYIELNAEDGEVWQLSNYASSDKKVKRIFPFFVEFFCHERFSLYSNLIESWVHTQCKSHELHLKELNKKNRSSFRSISWNNFFY